MIDDRVIPLFIRNVPVMLCFKNYVLTFVLKEYVTLINGRPTHGQPNVWFFFDGLRTSSF